MKFFHLADLHLGKRYGEMPLVSDQRYILDQILKLAKTHAPDAVLIAGDIYDKAVPSIDAVELFDGFLNGLTDLGVKAFVISGNHDSAERLAFGAKLVKRSGVYLSPVFSGKVEGVTLTDSYGKVNIYCLPFIKPATVKRFFPEREILSYTQTVSAAIETMNIDENERNVLVAHQFVTGGVSAGSEEVTVGDVGNVDAEVFKPFDYVALGHIHGAQNVASERVRYCGTPLKYSLSEKDNEKSVTVIELKAKGELEISTLPLTPLRDVCEIRGSYGEITCKSYYENAPFKNALLHVVLTDEEEEIDAFAKLRLIYPNLMGLRYDNVRTRADACLTALSAVEEKSPMELFCELYEKQNNSPMSEEQVSILSEMIDKVWGDGE
ncbi:MAG: exonuclease SbcCD subunit D [Candidatus Coproplasma sp.]